MFSVESVAWGHHIYKAVWYFVGVTLPCQVETGNTHDLHATPTDTASFFPAGFRYFNSTIHSYVCIEATHVLIFIKIFSRERNQISHQKGNSYDDDKRVTMIDN